MITIVPRKKFRASCTPATLHPMSSRLRDSSPRAPRAAQTAPGLRGIFEGVFQRNVPALRWLALQKLVPSLLFLFSAVILTTAIFFIPSAQAQSEAADDNVTTSPAQAKAPRNLLTLWERQFYGKFEGKQALLYNGSYYYGKPTFGDLNNDKLADLLLGKQDGTVALFLNRGSRGRPKWVLARENITSLQTSKDKKKGTRIVTVQVGGHAAPALVDIDHDQDLDLFVGSGDGRLFFYRNVGNPLLPAFTLVTETFVTRDFGRNLVPVFGDVDGNRSYDLVIGNREGEVFLLINRGTPSRAAFCIAFPSPDALRDEEPPCRPVPRLLNKLKLENNASPSLVDWDRDGDLDLFVGKSNGAIAYHVNRGTKFKPIWRLLQKRFLAIDEGGFAAPVFFEMNGDLNPDMLIGSSTNKVSLYTNKGTKSVMDVWKMTQNLFDIHRLGPGARRVIITSGDLDADGDVDLVLGDRRGRIIWLQNTGSSSNPEWRVRKNNLISTDRKNSAPFLIDLDGDGDLDLLVGGLDGRLWFVRNKGTAKAPSYALESTNFAAVDVGNDSVPILVDIDQDGDRDLFVGNRRGFIIYYRNEGNATTADFRLVSTKFGETSVRLNATPALFDWNGDKALDLVIGSRTGYLTLDVNKGKPNDEYPKNWEIQKNTWGEFRTSGYSAPHFVDINNDKRLDLVLSDGNGNVQLWFNRGKAPPPVTKSAIASAEEDKGEPADSGTESQIAGIPPAAAADSDSGLSALAGSDDSGQEIQSTEQLLLSEQEPEGPLDPIYVLASREYGKIKVRGRAQPAFGDLDGDDDLDLVVGSGAGKLSLYRNDGNQNEASWTKVTDSLVDFKQGPNPSPLLFDLDGDGDLDLIVGTENGRVLFYRNDGEAAAGIFKQDKKALAKIRAGRSAAPAAAQVDGDGQMDLVIGNFAGKLLAYVRKGKAQSLNFTLYDRRFMAVDVGVSSTPTLGDVDRDDKPDLLIGSDQGKLTDYVRTGISKKNPTGWGKGPDFFKKMKFPAVSRPALVDIDDDGDVDLLVGTGKGTIYFYRNDAVGGEEPLSQ